MKDTIKILQEHLLYEEDKNLKKNIEKILTIIKKSSVQVS
tara:strand:- start:27 stop:146 length:120 start_codon:yes stop_codon:yes gene_type:complete